MLDAYIIERIRRKEEERREGDLQQIRIDVPQHPPRPPEQERPPLDDRDSDHDGGGIVIDFQF